MSLRTIMIFPEFENMEIIDEIRKQFDPLADLVRPHITLVFPFESSMSNEELAQILEQRLADIKPFQLELGGISKQEDVFGNYLFLDVLQGVEEICRMHQVLYENEFQEFNKGLQYVPHMTVGKLETAEELDNAYKQVKFMESTFHTEVRKISVEMIGENEESIIVVEKVLG